MKQLIFITISFLYCLIGYGQETITVLDWGENMPIFNPSKPSPKIVASEITDSTIVLEVEYPSYSQVNGYGCLVIHPDGICSYNEKPRKRFTIKISDAIVEDGVYEDVPITQKQFVYKKSKNN